MAVGRTLRHYGVVRSVVPVCVFFVLFPYWTQATESPCICDREELLATVRSAETIFYGSVEEATMESATSDTIQLILNIRDPIRGQESGRFKVSTTLPDNCGVVATLGMHSLFVVSGDNTPVTRCGGSGSHYFERGHNLGDLHNLVFAVFAVEYVDRDPSVVRSWLDRAFGTGYSRREDMQGFFSLIGELDTDMLITINDNEVIYRNMVFVFTDDVLVDYFWQSEN